MQEQFEVGEDKSMFSKEKKNKNSISILRSKKKLIYFSFLLFALFFTTISIFVFQNKNGSHCQLQEPFLGQKVKQIPVLVSDIGGTNCRLKLLKVSTESSYEEPKEIFSDVLKSWEYQSIEELIKHFLKPFVKTENYPKFAVLGIPGAIINNTMQELVNIPQWKKTNGEELAKKLNMKKLVFLNDFVCNGFGIQANLKEGKDFIIINDKPLNNFGKKFVIGPGTGLGQCFLIKNEGEKYYNVYGTEGGHQDYAAKNDMQYGYLKYLQKYFNIKYISTEKACAGPALIPMYKYLKNYYNGKVEFDKDLADSIEPISMNSKPETINNINKEIVNKGIKGTCKLSRKVLEFFVELLGHISGNSSIYTLPYGGIYIVGGLSAQIQDIYKSGIFQNALLQRPEQNNLLQDIPIILILNKDLGMIGAIECAKRMAIEEK